MKTEDLIYELRQPDVSPRICHEAADKVERMYRLTGILFDAIETLDKETYDRIQKVIHSGATA